MPRFEFVLAVIVSAAAWLMPLPLEAAVVDVSPNGFSIEQKIHIAATPDVVYFALIAPAKWWSSDHTFSGQAKNLTLDAIGGGCFCERWEGGSVQHAAVVSAISGKELRLRGPLGPFQGQGVDGALTFSLRAEANGTELTLENNVGGYMKGGYGKWPDAADAMLAGQMARLKRLLETGSPDSKTP